MLFFVLFEQKKNMDVILGGQKHFKCFPLTPIVSMHSTGENSLREEIFRDQLDPTHTIIFLLSNSLVWHNFSRTNWFKDLIQCVHSHTFILYSAFFNNLNFCITTVFLIFRTKLLLFLWLQTNVEGWSLTSRNVTSLYKLFELK